MPTYRFVPNYSNPYQSDKLFIFDKVVNANELVEGDVYFSEETLKALCLEFISDEPYTTPIVNSVQGSLSNGEILNLEIPDGNFITDLYINVLSGPGYINVGFNNNPDITKMISVKQSGKIFEKLEGRRAKVVNMMAVGSIVFCAYLTQTAQMIDPKNRGI